MLLENKPVHIAIITGYILALFAIGHIGLVRLYKAGTVPTVFVFIALLVVAFVLILAPIKEYNFIPLLFGFMLWAAIGEAGEHLEISDVVNFKNIFMVILFVGFYFYATFALSLPKNLILGFGFFLMIWVFHFVMLNQFEMLGKDHFSTYIGAGVFLAVSLFAMVMAIRTKEHTSVFTALFVSSVWSLLEYVWGWKLIPKPW